MCGRYSLFTDLETILERFSIEAAADGFEYEPAYNIAPGQEIVTVINSNGSNKIGKLKWGLIPFWAKDSKIGNKLINARAETIAKKPSFKHSFQRKRCLVLGDSFYEWKKEDDKKIPMRIRVDQGRLFAMAGLWDKWKDKNGESVFTCTIITTRPNDLMKDIHNRMPVILSKEEEQAWLDPRNQNANDLEELLVPFPEHKMDAYRISSAINSPKNNFPECIKPISG
ncbi:SOS response-associated peptidase [Pseudalkalibacillus caeni]|uniref:Abasic site processing protein n=1 Tax=Exobacillus caeni TaxID=2574798 RepID=A0A5R9F5E5_9BACL|nr:SOS response-associated peptidase [Pseudalkalibacillus caeni]TLS35704.1 SOS response-associated peptidase [Pseudalkalibacillus caeni]